MDKRESVRGSANPAESYTTPELTTIGAIEEITRGSVPGQPDGGSPGSNIT